MQLGMKIKKIRQFRGMTQKQLGLLMGFRPENADLRIRQYEQGRTPRINYLTKLAEALNVNVENFTKCDDGGIVGIMQTLFWLDESNVGTVNIFRTKSISTNSNKNYAEGDENFCFHEKVSQEPDPRIGVWFKYSSMDDYLDEWLDMKKELEQKSITREEYFEWKLNWPNTSSVGMPKDYNHSHLIGRSE